MAIKPVVDITDTLGNSLLLVDIKQLMKELKKMENSKKIPIFLMITIRLCVLSAKFEKISIKVVKLSSLLNFYLEEKIDRPFVCEYHYFLNHPKRLNVVSTGRVEVNESINIIYIADPKTQIWEVYLITLVMNECQQPE
ncbi:hypothetical protein [Niallia circulans]|uniref:hypothetical protein n=1 Tax=Niallia circulans TaxID=1397 RepID=UPI00352C00C7